MVQRPSTAWTDSRILGLQGRGQAKKGVVQGGGKGPKVALNLCNANSAATPAAQNYGIAGARAPPPIGPAE